jgi:hypothetical protein
VRGALPAAPFLIVHREVLARERADLRGLARDPRWREARRAGYVFTDDRNDVLSLIVGR